MASFTIPIKSPRSSLRSAAPALLVGLLALAASALADLRNWLPAPTGFHGQEPLAALLSYFGVATLIASIALSLVQSATDKWPSYIYEPIRNERERDGLLQLILVGFIVSGGGLLSLSQDGLDGWPALLLSGLLALISVTFLLGYTMTRITMFDPLQLAGYFSSRVRRHSAHLHPHLDWQCRRPHGSATPPHRARACRNQEEFWRSLDRLLGLGRWLTQSQREQDADEILHMAMGELERYAEWRRRRPGSPGPGLWSRDGGAQLLGESELPGPQMSLFYGFGPLIHTTSHLWVERLSTMWLSRYVTFLMSHGDGANDWNKWLDFAAERALEAARLVREGDGPAQADLQSLVRSILRPLRIETANARRGRDATFLRLAALVGHLIELPTEARGAALRCVRSEIERTMNRLDRRLQPDSCDLADDIARVVMGLRAQVLLRRAGLDDEAALYGADIERCVKQLVQRDVANQWSSLPLEDNNTLLGRLGAVLREMLNADLDRRTSNNVRKLLEWLLDQIADWRLPERDERVLRAELQALRGSLRNRGPLTRLSS